MNPKEPQYELRIARTLAHLWTVGSAANFTGVSLPYSRPEDKTLAHRIVEALNASTGTEACRAVVLRAIEAEAELPGEIPDDLYYRLKIFCDSGDRVGVAEVLRLVVRTTKSSIQTRVLTLLSNGGGSSKPSAA